MNGRGQASVSCPWAVSDLQKDNIMFAADSAHRIRPDTGLDFADMCPAKKNPAQAGLTDSAANGAGHISLLQHLMIGQSMMVVLAVSSNLPFPLLTHLPYFHLVTLNATLS